MYSLRKMLYANALIEGTGRFHITPNHRCKMFHLFHEHHVTFPPRRQWVHAPVLFLCPIDPRGPISEAPLQGTLCTDDLKVVGGRLLVIVEVQAAQRAIEAYQTKQQSLQMLLMLNAVGQDEQVELERLRQAFLAEPAVAAYLQAHEQFAALCQEAADLLSRHIGLSFTAACGPGCC